MPEVPDEPDRPRPEFHVISWDVYTQQRSMFGDYAGAQITLKLMCLTDNAIDSLHRLVGLINMGSVTGNPSQAMYANPLPDDIAFTKHVELAMREYEAEAKKLKKEIADLQTEVAYWKGQPMTTIATVRRAQLE